MITQDFENTILESLIYNNTFCAKTINTLKSEMFEAPEHAEVFRIIKNYFEVNNDVPRSNVVMGLELNKLRGMNVELHKDCTNLVNTLYTTDYKSRQYNDKWLLSTTEEYIVLRCTINAVSKSISLIESQKSLEELPDLFRSAVTIKFDPDLGHDYAEDALQRFEYYKSTEAKTPFSLDWLNDITNGGFPKKTLLVPVAPTGVGKTLFLTSEAAFQLLIGKNVLFISLEMSQERIAQRIDAKLLDLKVTDFDEIPTSSLVTKFDKIKSTFMGKLKIKEYAPKTITCNTIHNYLTELEFRENFVPDIIMVDYLNLIVPTRNSALNGDYAINKAVAEELRAIAVQWDCTVISPTQTNREGQDAEDFSLTQVSESHGISMTADFMFGIISTPEMEKENRIKFKQLKNRFGDLNNKTYGIIGINRAKMKLENVESNNTNQKSSKPVNNSIVASAQTPQKASRFTNMNI